MKIEIEFPKITVDQQFVEKLDLPKIMNQEMLTTRTRVIQQLNKGQDAEGAHLRPYSPGYAKLKLKSGRSTTPNLNWTGELHRSMQIQQAKSLSDGETKMTFSGTHKGGISNAGLASSLYRRGFTGWFRFGQRDVKRIQEAVLRAVEKNIKKLIDVK